MKNQPALLSLFITFLFFTTPIHSQNCTVPTAETELAVNNVKADIRLGGDLWWSDLSPGYIVPAVDPSTGLPGDVSAIFAGAVWMAGIDPAGNLKLAAQTYGSATGDTDYFAGPLDENGLITESQCTNFDRIWKVTNDDIQMHNADFDDNGTIDNPNDAIMGWPGKSNPSFESINGFDLPEVSHEMAPFVDLNGNGVYNPMAGDYPNINGATEGNWFVFNDAGGVHTTTGGAEIGMETHVLAYSYASSDDAINDATFYDYNFIYKGFENLDSTFVSIWIDPDLGCPVNDYIGCSPDNNLAFIYNQDSIDGGVVWPCVGVNGNYGEEIPIVGIKILDGIYAGRVFGQNGDLEIPAPSETADTVVSLGMTSFIYFNNGGLGAPSGTEDPAIDTEYYNYMNGVFRDGLPITPGGDGHSPNSGPTVSYAFPDNPAEVGGWSMCQEGLPAGDRRMLINSGPFRMSPGSVNRLSFAVIYQPNVPHPCPDINGLVDIGNEVQAFFKQNVITTIETPLYNESSLTLSPNPFTNQTQLRLDDANEQLQHVQLFSITGQLLRSYNSLSANSLTIEKGNLTTGMYIYKALAKDGKAYSGKFIVE